MNERDERFWEIFGEVFGCSDRIWTIASNFERQVPDWQTVKIDAACDFWEMQLLGIRL